MTDSVTQLTSLVHSSLTNKNAIASFGGINKLFSILNVNSQTGVDDTDVENRRQTYGVNSTKKKKKKEKDTRCYCFWRRKSWRRFWVFISHCMFFAMTLLKVLYLRKDDIKAEYSSVTLFITSIVYSIWVFFEYLRERCRNKKVPVEQSHTEDSMYCSVFRSGQYKNITYSEVVVGDIVKLEPTLLIPADMAVLESKDLVVDERYFSGNSSPVLKAPNANIESSHTGPETHVPPSPVLLAGTTVTSGSGHGLVLAVGKNTLKALSSPKYADPKTDKKKLKKHTPFKFVHKYTKYIRVAVTIIALAILIIKFIYLAGDRENLINNTMDLHDVYASIILDIIIGVWVFCFFLPRFVIQAYLMAVTRAKKNLAKENIYIKREYFISIASRLDELIIDEQVLRNADDAKAIKYIQKYGIRVRFISSQSSKDAADTAQKYGLPRGTIAEGSQITSDSIANIIDGIDIIVHPQVQTRAILLDELQKRNRRVGMFGSNFEDVIIMRKADVGFCLTQAPEIVKDASDVVLIRNSVASVFEIIKAGRQLHISSRRTVAQHFIFVVSILILNTVAAIATGEDLFRNTQIVWMTVFNFFIMWALTTDKSDKKILAVKPRESKKLSSRGLVKLVLFQIGIISAIILVIFFSGEDWVPDETTTLSTGSLTSMTVASKENKMANGRPWETFDKTFDNPTELVDGTPRLVLAFYQWAYWWGGSRHYTLMFNTFVAMIICNLFAVRRLWAGQKLYKKLSKNTKFLMLFFLLLIMQFIVGNYGGQFFQVYRVGLTVVQWVIVGCFGLLAIFNTHFWRFWLRWWQSIDDLKV